MLLEPPAPIPFALECDICQKRNPKGTLMVCLPDHDNNSDPYGCVDCTEQAGFEIAASEEEVDRHERELIVDKKLQSFHQEVQDFLEEH